jgi:hypothetical protein
LEHGGIRHRLVHHIEALGHADKEPGERPAILRTGQASLRLCTKHYLIEGGFLLSNPGGDRAADVIPAPWALQCGIRDQTPPRLGRIARASENRRKHPLDGPPWIRVG